MPREVMDVIEGKELGGVYVISVPSFRSTRWLKIGMAEGDIAKRLRTYSTYYPDNFWVHAMILYPNNYKKFLHARKAETHLHNLFGEEDAIWGYPNQSYTEWYSLSKKQKKELYAEMKKIAKETKGEYHYFANDWTIRLPKK